MDPRLLARCCGPFAFLLVLFEFAPQSHAAESFGPPARVVRINAPATTQRVDRVVRAARDVPPSPTRIMVSRGAYLPVVGSIQLRFGSSTEWPPPIPREAVRASDATIAETEVQGQAENTTPAAGILPETVEAAPAVSAAAMSVAAETPAPSPQTADGGLLTANVVLAFLGDIPVSGGRSTPRFEPPQPDPNLSPSATLLSPP